MTVFLGTLWCSIKKIEAPYVFNWKSEIALHEMQGNQPSSPSEVYVSWDSRVVAGTWVYSRVTVGMAIRNSSLFSEIRLLSSYDGHLRNLNYA